MDWEQWWEWIKEHRGKILGVGLGLLFGWFAIVYGFWKAVFVALCVAVGYFLGKKVDERTDWRRLWERFFRSR
ncbi:DUF2273 domain-containing protein [Ammonifex thiophilus]|uniref:DUF2273 domain-containing protein n=1 Tax=Ammonifex thiophilus TaxID=444093 RepID=A0A3D8P380_9THEO|nr:DUF2273 domain-containing protein [Ammonifex thiophilus]RDV83046.1 DUF2273 domain-containing protein [Ammonifex thiophilus]